MAADHVRGEMDVSHHKSTYDGFMAVSLWSSLIIGLSVLYMTLVFAVGTDWLGSLIGVTIAGVVAGLVLKMKAAWYATVAGMFILTLISGGIVMLFGAAIG
ncbi:aa3-type cytochrome c oxidase subunit IV [Maricaulis sp. CAU 1757]